MRNQPRDEGPTQKQVDALIADVMAIQKRIEGFTVSLTDAERRGITKMRPGGEGVVATLVQVAQQHDVKLPEVSATGIAGDLALAQRLRPLGEATRQLFRRVEDTILNAQGDCWWSATALYTALSRIAAGNATLQASLRSVVAFFATGPRKKTPPHGTPVTPPVTPPAAPPAV
jgi:hypothetical protein